MKNVFVEQEQGQEGKNVRLKLGGDLDKSGVYQLRDRILGLSKGSDRLVLDFTGVSATDVFALSVLAMWIADRRQNHCNVECIGLDKRAEQILASFGAPANA